MNLLVNGIFVHVSIENKVVVIQIRLRIIVIKPHIVDVEHFLTHHRHIVFGSRKVIVYDSSGITQLDIGFSGEIIRELVSKARTDIQIVFIQFREITLLDARPLHRHIAPVGLYQVVDAPVGLQTFDDVISRACIEVELICQCPFRIELVDEEQVVVGLLAAHETSVCIRRLVIGIHTQIVAHRFARSMQHNEIVCQFMLLVMQIVQVCHNDLRSLYIRLLA